MKKIFAVLFGLTYLFFTGCSQGSSVSEGQLILLNEVKKESASSDLIKVTGRAVINCSEQNDAAFSTSFNLSDSRSAVPDYSKLNIKFSGVYVSGGMSEFEINDDGTFSLYIPTGLYRFTINAFDSSSAAKKYFTYSDTTDRTISAANHDLTFFLEPYQTGTGTVELPVSVYDKTKIPMAKAEWKQSDGTTVTETLDFTADLTAKFYLSSTNASAQVSPGVYSVTFKFYSDAACTSSAYTCTEEINVFANMCTDKWTPNGTSVHFSGTPAVLYVSEELLKLKENRVFYVASGGSSTASGSYFDPFDFIDTAVQKVEALDPNGIEEYTIIIKGTLDSIYYGSSSEDDNNLVYIGSVTICPRILIKGDSVAGGTILARNSTIFSITNGNVKLENLIINVSTIQPGVAEDCLISFLRGTLEFKDVTINRTTDAGKGFDVIDKGNVMSIIGDSKIGMTKICNNLENTNEISGFVLADLADNGYNYPVCFDLKNAANESISYHDLILNGTKVISDTGGYESRIELYENDGETYFYGHINSDGSILLN